MRPKHVAEHEGKRLPERRLGAHVVATLAVGVSLGFPLFLYVREVALERQLKTPARAPGSQQA